MWLVCILRTHETGYVHRATVRRAGLASHVRPRIAVMLVRKERRDSLFVGCQGPRQWNALLVARGSAHERRLEIVMVGVGEREANQMGTHVSYRSVSDLWLKGRD
jgi:hypothetical protein